MLQVPDLHMHLSRDSDRFPVRTTVSILLFLVCCLLSSFRLIHNAPAPAQVSPDDIAARSDQRFSALKAQLPERGVIGYVGESGNSGTADYYLAQYALAPLVIDHSANHPLVIGSYPTAAPQFPEDLRLVRDFGNGVLLLARKDAK